MKPSLIFSLLSFLILLISGCGGNSHKQTSEKVLKLGNGGEPRDLDPQTITGTPETTILSSLLEGLVTYHPTDDNIPYPGVAERWEVSDDGTIWTFYLRKDAAWSNGDPVVASDFIYAWKRALTPALGCEYADWLYMIVGAEDYNRELSTDFNTVGLKAPSPHQLIIHLNHPVADFLKIILNHTFLPVHPPTVEAHGGLTRRNSGWTRAGSYVGNGPFQLTDWKPNSVIRIDRNPHYWDADEVKLDGIEFFPIQDEHTELRAFESKQLHITNSVPVNQREHYQRTQPDKIRFDPFLGIYYFWINTTKPPLDNPLVRQALSLAVDRKGIVENLTKAGERPATSYTPQNIGTYQPPNLIESNPTRAQAILAEAGYPNGVGFPQIEFLFNTSDNHRKIAEALQQMWKQTLGIDIVITNQEWQVYLNSLTEMDYQIARAGWIGNLYPSSFLRNFLSYSPNNNCGYNDPIFDQTLEKAMKTMDENKRNHLNHTAESILLNSLPVIPVYYYTNTFLIQPEVINWPVKLNDYRALKFVDLE